MSRMKLLDDRGYVGQDVFALLRKTISANPTASDCWVEAVGQLLRYNTVLSVARAGTGHLGASLSMVDIVAEIYFRRGRFEPALAASPARDIFILSKGHAAPGHYPVLAALGYFPNSRLDELRRWDGLPGHSHVKTPGVDANTGSLAMGLSRAVGIAIGRQRAGQDGDVFVVVGDGELQEGQVWEALLSAASFACDRLHVVIDANEVQTDQYVSDILKYRDLAGTMRAIGLDVVEVDGHSACDLRLAFEVCEQSSGRPHCLICRTVKGSGVSFMEHTRVLDRPDARYVWHNKAPNAMQLADALGEILARVRSLETLSVEVPSSAASERVPRVPPATGVRGKPLVPGFAEGVIELARRDERVIVLDADLEDDCGLSEFRRQFPDRFYELGIMEQHMCSVAGALCALGKLPVIVSYAAFLSSRSNEQIYNLATDPTCSFVLAGHLAGVIPATPGMSHQAFRDLGVLRSIPGLRAYQPLGPDDCRDILLRFIRGELGPRLYLRIAMAPSAIELPPGDAELPLGRSQLLRAGEDAILIAAGPVMTGEAMAAASLLAEKGFRAEVRHHPWVTDFDPGMLGDLASRKLPVVICEDHHVRGGLGEGLLAALAMRGLALDAVRHVGLVDLPDTGFRDEALVGMGLDRGEIVAAVMGMVRGATMLPFPTGRRNTAKRAV